MILEVEVPVDNLDEETVNELYERFEVASETVKSTIFILYDERDLAELKELVGGDYYPLAPGNIDSGLFEEIIENYAKEYFDAEELVVSPVADLIHEFLGEIDEDAAEFIEYSINRGCIDSDEVVQKMLERKYGSFDYEYFGDDVVVFVY